jgi:hypothetical protein
VVRVGVTVDVPKQSYSVSIDGKPNINGARFAEYVKTVERLSFRTGQYRSEPSRKTLRDGPPDLKVPDPDAPEPSAVYNIDDVRIQAGRTSLTAAK